MNGQGRGVVAISATLAIAAALALSGCRDAPQPGTGTIGEAPGLEGDASTPPVAPTPQPEPTVIQAKGFLQIADLGSDGTAEVLPGARVAEARINPCGGPLPSDESRVARAAVLVLYRFNDIPASTPDGTAYEVISRYRSGGATAYLQDLRAAVDRCPTRTEGEIEYQFAVEDSGFAGDESVLVSETARFDFEGSEIEDTSLIAAVRLGNLIILIDADGWEMSSALRSEVDRLVTAALARAVAA